MIIYILFFKSKLTFIFLNLIIKLSQENIFSLTYKHLLFKEMQFH
jgi:hypothetical protein